jgi:uncharacterized protein YecE (DUF72 family)
LLGAHILRVDRIHIGTSGFVYPHWRGLFYPRELPAEQWLDWYARTFTTCELNNTFYRLPRPEAVKSWRKRTPPGFLFAVKGSRFLTHMKRLLDRGRGIDRFFSPIHYLGPKLGPVLWQLPPQMTPDSGRLDAFLEALPRGVVSVFEFRNAVWYTNEVAAVLDRHGTAFCEHDLVDARPPRLTGGFRYLRFHGATGKYRGRYGRAGLRRWALDLAGWRKRGGTAFVYFNNDVHGNAVADAVDLSHLLEIPGKLPRVARRQQKFSSLGFVR